MEGRPNVTVMATNTESDVTNLKGTSILVIVEDALIDVLVVSFHIGSKIFQGALLDVTKKDAPCGIYPPTPVIPKEEAVSTSTPDGTDDKADSKISSLKLRHTYYQIPPGTQTFYSRPFSRYRDKSVRMRRLRPRKILCSCCAKQVSDDPNQKKVVPGVVTRNHASKLQGASPATKVAINGAKMGRLVNSSQRIGTRARSTNKSDSVSVNGARYKAEESKEEFVLKNGIKGDKMVLRKRKSTDVDSSDSSSTPPEKLKRLDVIKHEETEHNSANKSLAKTSPVIKISFANPQGQDTVVEIPRRIQNASDTEEDSVWSLQENSEYNTQKFSSTKAAKKALKRAKKAAQKRASTIISSSPISVLSPSNSGNNIVVDNALEKDKHHHHKHKMKRKRKHKDGEETESEKYDLENAETKEVFTPGTPTNDNWCLRTNFPVDIPPDINKSVMLDEVKSKCFQKKLSISLKRLNAQAYMRCSPKYTIEEDSIASDVSSTSNTSHCSGSGSDYGDVPDFPKHSSPLRDVDKVKPLMMRISTNGSNKTPELANMSVGDIVWGKIHGFPWWPGKVLALSMICENNAINNQAHVSWFGSSTSSYMSCSQLTPFLDDFKIRFNKKKRGPYKEAIKQALHEANLLSNEIHDLGFVAS